MPPNPATLFAVTQQLTVSRYIMLLAELPKPRSVPANPSHITTWRMLHLQLIPELITIKNSGLLTKDERGHVCCWRRHDTNVHGSKFSCFLCVNRGWSFSLVNYPHFPLSFSGTPALLWPRPTVGFSLQTLVVVNLVNSSISTLLSDGNCCYRTIGICFRHIFETNTFLLALYLRGILFFSSHSSE